MYQLAIFTLWKTCFICAMFENPLPRAQTLFYFKKPQAGPSVDTGAKIDSRAAAWNGLKCRTDSSLLYLDGTQSKSAWWHFSNSPLKLQMPFDCPYIHAVFMCPEDLCWCLRRNTDGQSVWQQENGRRQWTLVGKCLSLTAQCHFVSGVKQWRMTTLISFWENNSHSWL